MSIKPKTGSIDIHIQANRQWLTALPGLKKAVKDVATAAGARNVTIRFAEDIEVAKLNHDFRGKNKPTNVLSFPYVGKRVGEQRLRRLVGGAVQRRVQHVFQLQRYGRSVQAVGQHDCQRWC